MRIEAPPIASFPTRMGSIAQRVGRPGLSPREPGQSTSGKLGDMTKAKIEYIKTEALIPYARNSRTHSEQQVAQIAASIREFGFTNPVLIDADNGIIAGHGRVMAAQKLGRKDVPCLRLDHLTDAQKRAYVIADNKLALNAGWDDEMLRIELDELKAIDFDLSLIGFDDDELKDIFNGSDDTASESLSENYSRKIQAPIYEITGEKPKTSDLYNNEKTLLLKAEIDQADLPDDVKRFLTISADRHTVFNFKNIAEFYAHSDIKTQQLMEKSALVIIDFDQAIENGFVKLASGMMEQVRGIKNDQ